MTAPGSGLHLRNATDTDAYALWLWANDTETRAGSHGRGEITWPSHVQWLTLHLANPHSMILMAESDGRPVASVRFHTDDGWTTARLAYVVAPEARGRGLSRSLVSAGCARLRERYAAVAILAEVMKDNVRSASVFSGEGWRNEPLTPDLHRFWNR